MSKSKRTAVPHTIKKTRSKGSTNTTATPAAQLSEAQRHAMIAENAYYRSIERGPLNGDPMEDWLSAERMIDSAMLPHR